MGLIVLDPRKNIDFNFHPYTESTAERSPMLIVHVSRHLYMYTAGDTSVQDNAGQRYLRPNAPYPVPSHICHHLYKIYLSCTDDTILNQLIHKKSCPGQKVLFKARILLIPTIS